MYHTAQTASLGISLQDAAGRYIPPPLSTPARHDPPLFSVASSSSSSMPSFADVRQQTAAHAASAGTLTPLLSANHLSASYASNTIQRTTVLPALNTSGAAMSASAVRAALDRALSVEYSVDEYAYPVDEYAYPVPEDLEDTPQTHSSTIPQSLGVERAGSRSAVQTRGVSLVVNGGAVATSAVAQALSGARVHASGTTGSHA